MERKPAHEWFRAFWNRYKFVLLVVLIGVILLVWPTSKSQNKQPQASAFSSADSTEESNADTVSQMESILSKISGVGELHLMLTVETSSQLQLAQDTELTYSGTTAAPDDYSRKSETEVLSTGERWGCAPEVITQG